MDRRRSIVAVVLTAGVWIGAAAPGATQAPGPHDALLARLAVELAGERDVAPLSLDADGSSLHGVVYDRFTSAQLAARVAKLKGAPFDPLKPPASLSIKLLVVVAVPLACGDRTVRPTDVDIDDHGRTIAKWLPATGPGIQTILPGAVTPAGAIAVQFSDSSLSHGEVVKITYGGAVCAGTSKTVTLPVSATPARALERPSIDLAPGQQGPSGPITLNIAGVVDLDGHLRYASAAEASTGFGPAAMAAAMKMRIEPARVNGSPTPWASGLVVTFGAAAASAPAPDEHSTPDVPGLTAASGKCPISSDPSYGVRGVAPIRIGGGVEAPARELQYLGVLRGPNGQGLKYKRTGPVMLEQGKLILDAYEVSYTGLAPTRIYFDSSKEAPLMAPAGFTCASSIVVK